jgi:hypothetical protein
MRPLPIFKPPSTAPAVESSNQLLFDQRTTAKLCGLDEPFFIKLRKENPDCPAIRVSERRIRFYLPAVIAWLTTKFGPQPAPATAKRPRGRPRKNPSPLPVMGAARRGGRQ